MQVRQTAFDAAETVLQARKAAIDSLVQVTFTSLIERYIQENRPIPPNAPILKCWLHGADLEELIDEFDAKSIQEAVANLDCVSEFSAALTARFAADGLLPCEFSRIDLIQRVGQHLIPYLTVLMVKAPE